MTPLMPCPYVNEPWYPIFLMNFALNLLVLWAGIVINAFKRGYSPTVVAQFFAGLGALLMLHPAGLVLWASLNLAFLSSGIPGRVLAVCATYTLLLPVFFWSELFSPARAFRRSR